MTPRHPAKYSDALLPYFADLLPADAYRVVLDPFAGTGKLRSIRPDALLIEIEPEWAAISGTTVGDALALPYADGSIDAVCTSPTYGNRMADHHDARDASRRNTYKHALGHDLQPNNSGAMQWGEDYREFHLAAWREVLRVLRPGGRFVLNVKNHIRDGVEMRVAQWHFIAATNAGFAHIDSFEVACPGNRHGENAALRVDNEIIFVLEKRIIPIPDWFTEATK